jgi:hypothetical protein
MAYLGIKFEFRHRWSMIDSIKHLKQFSHWFSNAWFTKTLSVSDEVLAKDVKLKTHRILLAVTGVALSCIAPCSMSVSFHAAAE